MKYKEIEEAVKNVEIPDKELLQEILSRDQQIDELSALHESDMKEISWLRQTTTVLLKTYNALEALMKQLTELLERGKN